MRWRDQDTDRIEKLICTAMSVDARDAEGIFGEVWQIAVKRSTLSTDGPKEVYISILGTVLERVNRDGRFAIA